jgi:hypothetical protein
MKGPIIFYPIVALLIHELCAGIPIEYPKVKPRVIRFRVGGVRNEFSLLQDQGRIQGDAEWPLGRLEDFADPFARLIDMIEIEQLGAPEVEVQLRLVPAPCS